MCSRKLYHAISPIKLCFRNLRNVTPSKISPMQIMQISAFRLVHQVVHVQCTAVETDDECSLSVSQPTDSQLGETHQKMPGGQCQLAFRFEIERS